MKRTKKEEEEEEEEEENITFQLWIKYFII